MVQALKTALGVMTENCILKEIKKRDWKEGAFFKWIIFSHYYYYFFFLTKLCAGIDIFINRVNPGLINPLTYSI